MKIVMSNLDWRYLRPALVVLGLAVVFSAILIYLGTNYRQDMGDLYDAKQAEFGDVEMAIGEVLEDQKLTETYLDEFNALASSGAFDVKQRVDWVDAVNSARSKMKLPLVRYQISPQLAYTAEYLPGEEFVSVTTSQVKLEAGLLHEADLIDLFNWMDLYAPGQLHVGQCQLRRVEEVFGYYGDRANMTVLCDLNWFTIHPKNRQGTGDDLG